MRYVILFILVTEHLYNKVKPKTREPIIKPQDHQVSKSTWHFEDEDGNNL